MKKRMILALVLVLALLCLACSNDADEGANSSEGVRDDQSVSVAETGTESSAESTSSVTSGTTSADETSADSTSSESSTGTESSATSSDASTSSKPTESSKPAENSKPTEGSENGGSVDTSSGSGNPNPSQTAHKHSYKTTVVKPTCTEDGYTLHKCSCGDSYKDNEVPATGHELDTWTLKNVKAPTYTEPGIHERQCLNCGEWVVDESIDADWEPPVTDEKLVYQKIIAMKEKYPNGSKWDETNEYNSKAMGMKSGGCTGFAMFLSDAAFGNYWGYRQITDVTLEKLKTGDILIMEGFSHVVIVLEIQSDSVIIAEGNVAGTVGWGRRISREVIEKCTVWTRYDPPQKS